MKSSTTPDFWVAYQVLPERVRNLARKNYLLWQENPAHPSLHWKQLAPGLWSIRVGLQFARWRVCAVTPPIGSGSVRTTNSTRLSRVLSLSDPFGEDAAATDAKRRPSFQTKSPRRLLPNPSYPCHPWFVEIYSCSFVSVRG